jgi:DNA-binding transcriptional MerR regulator
MEPKRVYKIHEFAELAGVSVKALHEYDRLGLLSPRRTGTGYRLYRLADLEQLEQIVALKFLGLTLAQIKVVLKRPSCELPNALRLQRKSLEEKQACLAQAIRAIQQAEESINNGEVAGPSTLKTIIQVIQMKDGIEAMKKYYSDKEWDKRRRYYEVGPSSEWRELYRDANALLHEDPGGTAAQALGDRWLKLSVRAWQGDPDVQTDSPSAWMDRGKLAARHEATHGRIQSGEKSRSS